MKDEIVEIRKSDVVVLRNGQYISIPIVSEAEFLASEKYKKALRDLNITKE